MPNLQSSDEKKEKKKFFWEYSGR